MSGPSPASIADERDMANAMPTGKSRNSPEVAAYIAREVEIKALFKGDLADEYLSVVPRTVSDKVFDMAWESGHSSGFSQVQNDYQDLADLVILSVNATRL